MSLKGSPFIRRPFFVELFDLVRLHEQQACGTIRIQLFGECKYNGFRT